MRQILTKWAISLFCLFWLTYATAAELTGFRQIAQDTIIVINEGEFFDVDRLIAMQENLIQLGTAACLEHVRQHPEDLKMFQLVTENVQIMKSLSLNEIKEQWHAKRYLMEHGIEVDKLHENTLTGSLMDTVVHPVTAYIALTEYKTTRDKRLLTQVNLEMSEAINQLAYIE